eukprot:366444-Chlamydomonas_euryale.AAC.11
MEALQTLGVYHAECRGHVARMPDGYSCRTNLLGFLPIPRSRLLRLHTSSRSPSNFTRYTTVVKQLLFADGLVGLGGVAMRSRSAGRDRAVAALSPDITPQFADWCLYGVAQDRVQWRSL